MLVFKKHFSSIVVLNILLQFFFLQNVILFHCFFQLQVKYMWKQDSEPASLIRWGIAQARNLALIRDNLIWRKIQRYIVDQLSRKEQSLLDKSPKALVLAKQLIISIQNMPNPALYLKYAETLLLDFLCEVYFLLGCLY